MADHGQPLGAGGALGFQQHHGVDFEPVVAAVQPPARFGAINLAGNRVGSFSEKIKPADSWINGGFFVFEPGVMDYFVDDNEPLEQSPLINMTRDGELMAYRHSGFWHPMDTVRDRNSLNAMCDEGTPPWLCFDEAQVPMPAIAI